MRNDHQSVRHVSVVPGVKLETGDIHQVFLEDWGEGWVYKELVHAVHLQTVQSVVHGLESERLSSVIPVQEHPRHPFLPLNSNLHKETSNNMLKKDPCDKSLTIPKEIPHHKLSKHKLPNKKAQLLQLP